jgi:hypothetical protein
MNLSYKVRGEDIRLNPLNKFEMEDGNVVAIYQGSRGQYPDLDFIVKYRKEGIRLRTPSHTHWIIDLVLKGEVNKELTLGLVKEFINIYDEIKPFDTQEERDGYNLIYPQKLVEKYKDLNSIGALSVEMLLTFVELFSMCEKRTEGAFMFRNMLGLCKQYLEGEKDYYQVVGISKRV